MRVFFTTVSHLRNLNTLYHLQFHVRLADIVTCHALSLSLGIDARATDIFNACTELDCVLTCSNLEALEIDLAQSTLAHRVGEIRTPAGPSDNTVDGMPRRGMARVAPAIIYRRQI